MTRLAVRTAVTCLCLATLMACATPKTTGPPSVVAPAPPGPLFPPPAEELESYSLVRDDLTVAKVSADLAAASPADRPALLMRRAHAAFAAALKIRSEHGGPLGVIGWPPERDRFIAYCELALRDLDELLVAHPQSPEAPEALFTVGQINDYPNLNQFDTALATYRLTVERYPGTPWAQQAVERIRVYEGIIGDVKDSPHDGGETRPEPAR